MNKTYKDFKTVHLGCSDIATLIMDGCRKDKGMEPQHLYFGEDGSYSAYLVDDPDAEIGSHYSHVATFEKWLKIYDDEGLVFRCDAREIKVYRAGEFGCIIQLTA